MRFPLADWIDAHRDCRHNLGESGMHAELEPRPPLPRTPDRGVLDELRVELAASLGVAPERLVLTHGATEATSWVLFYLRKRLGPGTRGARVALPEYPSLVDQLALAGFRVLSSARPAAVAVVSRPRNPEGDLWPRGRLERWAEGARHLVVDETFREFTDEPSLAARGGRGVWATGTFTKFYGADHLRVGFAVAPPEEAEPFERFAGVLSDEVAPASAAGALWLLRRRAAVRREVRAILDRNIAHLGRLERGRPPPAGPVFFDRALGHGDALAEACLERSVLVCPGRFFGDPRGVRIGLTRRSFPVDYRVYLEVRATRTPPSLRRTGPETAARPRRGAAAPRGGARRSPPRR